MKSNLTFGIAACALFAASIPALAHHSFAMFDSTKSVTMTGTVKEFEWVNPHSWIHLTVNNGAGVPEEWAFEMGSPGQLAAGGLKKDSIKTGDVITITARPMKDGSRGGSGGALKDANGKCIGRCGGAAQGAAPGGVPD